MPIEEFTPPTKTLGSLGPEKADHPSLTYVDFIHQYTAAEWNQIATWVIRYYDALVEMEAALTILGEYIPGFAETIGEHETRLDNHDTALGAIGDYIASFASSIGDHETRLGAVEGDVEALQGQIEALDDAVESALLALDGRLDDLEGVVVEPGTNINVAPDTKHLVLTNTGTINLTWPDASALICCRVYAASGESTQTINFLRSAADTAAGTINGSVNDKSVVRTSASSDEAYQSWTMRGAGVGAWVLDLGSSNALENLRSAVASHTSSISTITGTTIPALATRVTDLESPTASDKNAAAVSWTTEKRIRNTHVAALAVFTTDATTGQWPIGEGRPLANFSTGAFGIKVAVPSGHYLNGVLNGNSGTLNASAAAAGNPLYTVLVTREDTDRWSWA